MEHAREAYCLNLHADYLCQHTGACCTAGWAIPIEEPAYTRVASRFHERASAIPLFVTGEALPEGASAIVGVRSSGACVFFDADRGRLCAVHRDIGEDALPSACRQFPRVTLHDSRGTVISLSHFCPTAAGLLRSTVRPAIVRAPSALALGGAVEGLDARDALPPLLHPGLLMDHDAYAHWERRVIDLLGRGDVTADQAVATMAAATQSLMAWQPGRTRCIDAVDDAFNSTPIANVVADLDADERRVALAFSSVPAGLAHAPIFDGFRHTWPAVSHVFETFDGTVRAYLAARAFGNWMAYHGRGLGAVVEYVQICLAVLRMEAARHSACSSMSPSWQTVIEPAIRHADLLLMHQSDMKTLARLLI
jgi:Fe-S-cluster containining protein